MKNVSIIYWSKGGNVEILAEKIASSAESAGAKVIIKDVADAKIEDVVQADAVALGSPSMINDEIEQKEMEPYVQELEKIYNNKKKLVLFGSYGWNSGLFIEKWKTRMINCGFNVVGQIIVRETPTMEQLEAAQELGVKLSN